MDWAENLLFNNGNHVESSTCIEAAELVDNDKIQVGLQYNNDGHRFEVKSICKDGKKCKVTEEWISEDTGKEVKKTYTYVIESDADGREYMYDPNYADYKDECINSNGRVENGSHSTIGYFSDSRFENGSHSTIGYYSSGRFENGSHSTIGYLSGNRVENGSHSTIGYISNGRVENGSHSTIGYYPSSLKTEWVAVFYFFMKR